MESMHGAANCRWATPTLFMSQPLWQHAWDSPWTCVRGGILRVLRSSDLCNGCSHWEARTDAAASVPATSRPAVTAPGMQSGA